MRSVIFGVMFLWAFSANATSTTLDFEELPAPGTGVPSVFSTQGYVLSGEGMGIWGDGYAGYPTNYLTYNEENSGPITLDRADGNLFSLDAIDLFFPAFTDGALLTITGTKADLSTVTTQLLINDVTNTFYFSDAWQGLDYLEFGEVSQVGYFVVGMDNIAVTAVPIPAAVWLFGSALAGLGWLRRKQVT